MNGTSDVRRVDLYGILPSLSYQLAFVYIRQLAIHQRNALMAKSKESFKGYACVCVLSLPLPAFALFCAVFPPVPRPALNPLFWNWSSARVYNWQYLNCLRVWSRVLSQHAESAGIRTVWRRSNVGILIQFTLLLSQQHLIIFVASTLLQILNCILWSTRLYKSP